MPEVFQLNEPISTDKGQAFDLARRYDRGRQRRSAAAVARLMRRCGLLSLGVHAALLAGLLLWMQRGGASVETPDTPSMVELVMLEQQGSGATRLAPNPAPPMPQPAPEAGNNPAPPPAESPVPPPLDAAKPADTPPSTTEPVDEAALPPPPPTPAPTQVSSAAAPKPPRAPPPAPQSSSAPTINIGGMDSETNAIVTGDRVIPASTDTRSRNKEPVYPPDAVRRAEQGEVILLVHVSPFGAVGGIDVIKSSGFVGLDRAALDAVGAWHFLPAVKDGLPIPSDMPLRIVFRLD